MNIETAVKLAKPFVGSLNKNPGSRPILKTALVTEEYVIATNSHILIRIKHDETIEAPYIHKYKEYDELFGMEASSYPKTDRLFPDPSYANSSGTLDTKEMFEAIEGACVCAEFNMKVDLENAWYENKQLAKHLQKTKDEVKAAVKPKVVLNKDRMEVKSFSQNFETGSYTYTFDNPLPLEESTFNVGYLKTVFKTFKAAKEPEIKAHWTSNMRPWLLTAGNIEIIILPVRTW